MDLNVKKRIENKFYCFNYSKKFSGYIANFLFGSLLFLNTTFISPKIISCGNVAFPEHTKKHRSINHNIIKNKDSNFILADLKNYNAYTDDFNNLSYSPLFKYNVDQFKLFPINFTNIDLLGLSISNTKSDNYENYKKNIFNDSFINHNGLMLFYNKKNDLNFRQERINNKIKTSSIADNSNNTSRVKYLNYGYDNLAENGRDKLNNNSDISGVVDSYNAYYGTKNLLARELAISSYSEGTRGKFVDNEYFKLLREKEAIMQIKKYDIAEGSIVTVVNKTFQKAVIMRVEYSSDYDANLDNNNYYNHNNYTILKTNTNENINLKDTSSFSSDYTLVKILCEFDCSTSKIYGNKIFYGDGKTPEGLFFMSGPENSSDWLYDGLLMYGPNFLRLKKSIGIHGNGTDTSKDSLRHKDKRYSAPQQLGIYNNNFGSGLSHGCIRFDNNALDYLIKNNFFDKGNPVIIFEDYNLTRLLSKYYNKSEVD